jgi:outer membrane protein
MKKSILSLLAVAAFSLTAFTSRADTAPKILTIDLAKIFDTHYKTQEQQAKLQADEAKAKEQLDQIAKDGNALVEQFKELQDQAKNPAATADAKAKAETDAKKKYEEIQNKQAEQQQFISQTSKLLQQRFQAFKSLLLDEIIKTATEIAKEKGATLLIDKSGPSMVGISNILYSDPSLDITDEVVAQINKGRPATTPAPAAAAAPAATTAPAAGDAPKITVPGIK